jgi:hypothetical protein
VRKDESLFKGIKKVSGKKERGPYENNEGVSASPAHWLKKEKLGKGYKEANRCHPVRLMSLAQH